MTGKAPNPMKFIYFITPIPIKTAPIANIGKTQLFVFACLLSRSVGSMSLFVAVNNEPEPLNLSDCIEMRMSEPKLVICCASLWFTLWYGKKPNGNFTAPNLQQFPEFFGLLMMLNFCQEPKLNRPHYIRRWKVHQFLIRMLLARKVVAGLGNQ